MRGHNLIFRTQSSLFIGTLIALLCCYPVGASAVTECDRQAGHSLDPDKVVAGISRSGMDLVAAEKACREAVEEYPAHARSNYQLGRVLYYQGRGKESLPFLTVAADAGYPQALFVLGFIQTIDDQLPIDYCEAARLWQQSAALDHPWTTVYLPWEYLKGNFKNCDITLSEADIARFEQFAIKNIPYGDSEGRIEALQSLMQERAATDATE